MSQATIHPFLSSVRIILVRTFHPGNIGAAARAMKTMGLEELYLVDPVGEVDDEALSRAAGASDILNDAKQVATLEQAIEGCASVYATSARKRGFEKPQLNIRHGAQQIWQEQQKVAIVFGPERTGLSNQQLALCSHHLYIPANPDYGILNMASAVQVICHELLQAQPELSDQAIFAHNSGNLSKQKSERYPTRDQVLHFYQQLEGSLSESGFIKAKHPGQSMLKLQQFFDRARPNQTELNMLQGLLASLSDSHQKKAD